MSRTYRKGHEPYKMSPKECRDKKKWYKPDKKFKELEKAKRKAKERQAFREGKDVPEFPKNNDWLWN